MARRYCPACFNSGPSKTPEETEYALMELTPRERWSDINRYLVRHGQEICQPNRPHCDRCMVSDMCQYAIDRK